VRACVCPWADDWLHECHTWAEKLDVVIDETKDDALESAQGSDGGGDEDRMGGDDVCGGQMLWRMHKAVMVAVMMIVWVVIMIVAGTSPGQRSLMLSSMGTGAMFSPPAPMMSSLYRPVIFTIPRSSCGSMGNTCMGRGIHRVSWECWVTTSRVVG
jgi:hypothetical protein